MTSHPRLRNGHYYFRLRVPTDLLSTIQEPEMQTINNQRLRKSISGNTIINFHVKTGVSLDWLVGSWSRNIDAYRDCNRLQHEEPPISADHSAPKYLSLVEVLDQQNGEVELKWCLTQHRICLDNATFPYRQITALCTL